ncbi:MAG: YkgJ family cysteine cluster protein [Thermodesulfobacteriota bacterium]
MFAQHVPGNETKLGPGETFSFSCHSDLACFNACCRNKYLPLTPYDVLRLKQGLRLSSDEFIARHTLYWMDPETGFPLIRLRMGEPPDGACPFVSLEGCRVYHDRPTACRLYPLGRAVRRSENNPDSDPFFFLMETPGCLGRHEGRVWSVKAWEDNQGLNPYERMNDRMLDVVFHAGRRAGRTLSEEQVRKVIVACYNLDVFREVVFSTRFIDAVQLDEAARDRAAADDTALLGLGMAYLEKALYARPAG